MIQENKGADKKKAKTVFKDLQDSENVKKQLSQDLDEDVKLSKEIEEKVRVKSDVRQRIQQKLAESTERRDTLEKKLRNLPNLSSIMQPVLFLVVFVVCLTFFYVWTFPVIPGEAGMAFRGVGDETAA